MGDKQIAAALKQKLALYMRRSNKRASVLLFNPSNIDVRCSLHINYRSNNKDKWRVFLSTSIITYDSEITSWNSSKEKILKILWKSKKGGCLDDMPKHCYQLFLHDILTIADPKYIMRYSTLEGIDPLISKLSQKFRAIERPYIPYNKIKSFAKEFEEKLIEDNDLIYKGFYYNNIAGLKFILHNGERYLVQERVLTLKKDADLDKLVGFFEADHKLC